MATLLHLRVSSRNGSHSRRIGDRLAAALLAARPDLNRTVRDLGLSPLPHPAEPFIAANLTPDDVRGPAERAALALSEELIGELEAADLVVIDTPMHNFTVPSALKAWIDHVVRPRRTFGYADGAKTGLLADRPVLVVVACGGRFGDGHGLQTDFLEPYLRYVFACIGITGLEVLRLEAMTRGAEALARAEAAAGAWIAERVAERVADLAGT